MVLAGGLSSGLAGRDIGARDNAARTPRLTALLLNGGGTPSINYQSHLVHLRMLVRVLREAGVPEGRITILSGDGPNPSADVALREGKAEEDFWLLTGTRLEGPLRTPITFESTSVPGYSLKAATNAEIDRWFETVGSRLKDGDTLLLYVTDHGTKNAGDTRDNRITLWGKNQSLSVNALRGRLGR